MPRITVTSPFNFGLGTEVKHYPKGPQDMPQAAAAFAQANGFAEAEAPKQEKPRAARHPKTA